MQAAHRVRTMVRGFADINAKRLLVVLETRRRLQLARSSAAVSPHPVALRSLRQRYRQLLGRNDSWRMPSTMDVGAIQSPAPITQQVTPSGAEQWTLPPLQESSERNASESSYGGDVARVCDGEGDGDGNLRLFDEDSPERVTPRQPPSAERRRYEIPSMATCERLDASRARVGAAICQPVLNRVECALCV
jgi:hypothetical protein